MGLPKARDPPPDPFASRIRRLAPPALGVRRPLSRITSLRRIAPAGIACSVECLLQIDEAVQPGAAPHRGRGAIAPFLPRPVLHPPTHFSTRLSRPAAPGDGRRTRPDPSSPIQATQMARTGHMPGPVLRIGRQHVALDQQRHPAPARCSAMLQPTAPPPIPRASTGVFTASPCPGFPADQMPERRAALPFPATRSWQRNDMRHPGRQAKRPGNRGARVTASRAPPGPVAGGHRRRS